MIISQISSNTPLSVPVVKAFIEAVAKSTNEVNFSDGLLCLIYLTQTQNVNELSSEVLKHLLASR
jgi:hypothetical protein